MSPEDQKQNNQPPDSNQPPQPVQPSPVPPQPQPPQSPQPQPANPAPQQPPAPVAVPQQPVQPAGPQPVAPNPGQMPQQPAQATQPAAAPTNPKTFKKTIILIIVGVVALMAIGFGLFTLLANQATNYSEVEELSTEDFTVNVPTGWLAEEESGFYFYCDAAGEENCEDSQAGIMLFANANYVPGWSSISESEKNEAMDNALQEYKDNFDSIKPEDFTEWSLVEGDREKHPNGEVSFRILFEGQTQTGERVKGEIWDLVEESGYEHAVLVFAETSIWDRNEETFKEVAKSFNPN